MKINRLINDPYWEQLPDVVEEYLKESQSEEFYFSSDEFLYPAQLTREFVLTIVFNRLNNISIETFINEQKVLKGQNKQSISKKDLIKISKTLGRTTLKREMGELLDKFLENIQVDAWVMAPELQGYVYEQHNNLHEVYIMFWQISRLTKFREKPMISLKRIREKTNYYWG